MNLIRLFQRLLLAALLALPCVALRAQQETPKARAPQSEADFITIDFPGGPLSKLAAKLNEAGDPKLSIVQSPGLDPMLPAFSVRNVRVMAVIAALGNILEPQGFRLNPMDSNLAVLSKIERHSSPAFASFQLDSKIGTFPGQASAEDIIAAIQQGCEFASQSKPSTLRFKYHPATKLLFVAGTEQEVDVAHRVFGSLPNNLTPAKSQPTPPPDKK